MANNSHVWASIADVRAIKNEEKSEIVGKRPERSHAVIGMAGEYLKCGQNFQGGDSRLPQDADDMQNSTAIPSGLLTT